MIEEVDEILERVDMEYFLDREGIEYKHTHGFSGPQLWLKVCPSCGNEKWKIYLGQDTGFGKCHRCDQGFNKFTFIRAHTGADNKAAIEFIRELGREIGWMPKRKRVATEEDEGPTKVKMVPSFALPTEEGLNLDYLRTRGITDESCTFFGLRYCEFGKYKAKRPDGKKAIRDFSDRVIIPVHDLDGRLVNFQGRDISGKSPEKYVFPPGLPGTARFLYNAHNVVGLERVVAGEGAFDTIKTHQALQSVPEYRKVGAIGTFGMHLSGGIAGEDDQMSRLLALKRRGLKEVVFMWDGEAAAFERAIGAALTVGALGLIGRVAMLPPGKDPGVADQREIISAFETAVEITRMSAMRLRLNNPYSRL